MPNLRTADGCFWIQTLTQIRTELTFYYRYWAPQLTTFSPILSLFHYSKFQTLLSLSLSLSLGHYRGLCPFTSSAAISSLSTATTDFNEPLLSPHGETFVIAALGKDSKLILDNDSFISKFCQNPNRPLQRALPAITSRLPHDGTGGCAGTVFISEEGEGEGAVFCVKRVLFMFSI
jgi:hypothetical protein